jgi:hypothetical protein
MPRFLPVIDGLHWSAEQEKSVFNAGQLCSSYAVAFEVCSPGDTWRALEISLPCEGQADRGRPTTGYREWKERMGLRKADMSAIERMRISPAGADDCVDAAASAICAVRRWGPMSEKGWLVLYCAPLFHTFCNFHNLVPCSQCNTDSDVQRIDCGP